MRPTVSVCRKGEDLYLTLEGDFNHLSSQQLLQALRKLVVTSLKCFAADSPVAFTFKTHGKVDPKKTASAQSRGPWPARLTAVASRGDHQG